MPQKKKVVNLIKCPHCGNEREFIEVAEDAVTMTHYIQNSDGSFTIEDKTVHDSGHIKLLCGACEEDLTFFYNHFSEMIF